MSRESAISPAARVLILTPLIGVFFGLFVGCDKHDYDLRELRRAAQQFAFSEATSDDVELLLDSSASMRGFALAEVQDQGAHTGSWGSVFVGIDALGRNIRLSRFGGTLEEHPGPVSLLQLARGSQRVEPIRQARLEPSWRSRSCGQQLFHGPEVVTAIDSLFSERETCLGLALDQASREPSNSSLRLVLTDSEQAAGDESAGCQLGNNPTPVQNRLYDWVHTQRRFGAIALFRLPYEGWRVDAPTRDYCHCANRNLFVYLLGPSAFRVEEAYARIADRWRGEAQNIAYLPLAPRPAAQYQLRMVVPRTAAGNVPASIEGAQQDLQPESGRLPVFFLRLDDEKAVVRFTLAKAAFGPARVRGSIGGPATLPLPGDLDWGDQPTLVKIVAPTKDSKGRSLRLDPGPGAFEFVRLPDSSAQEKVAHLREARFLSAGRKIADREMSDLQLAGSWEVRRRPGAKESRCELYLFELHTQGDDLVDRLIAATPLLQSQDQACSGLDNITAQVRHVYQESPVARFLLHIDS